MNYHLSSDITGRVLIRELQRNVEQHGKLTLLEEPPSPQRNGAIINLAKRAGLCEIPANIKPEDHKDYAVTFLFYELETGFWVFETPTEIAIHHVALLPVPSGAYESAMV